jgi:hypothetical protein
MLVDCKTADEEADRYKHNAEVASLFGGPDARLLVAYYKNQSLGARFIKASR